MDVKSMKDILLYNTLAHTLSKAVNNGIHQLDIAAGRMPGVMDWCPREAHINCNVLMPVSKGHDNWSGM